MRNQNQDMSRDKVAMMLCHPKSKYITVQSIDVDDIIAVRPIEVYKTDDKGNQVVAFLKTEVTYKDRNGLCHVDVTADFPSFDSFVKEYGNRFFDAFTKGGHYVNCKMPFRVVHRKSGYVLVIYPPKPYVADAHEFHLCDDFEDQFMFYEHYINALVI